MADTPLNLKPLASTPVLPKRLFPTLEELEVSMTESPVLLAAKVNAWIALDDWLKVCKGWGYPLEFRTQVAADLLDVSTAQIKILANKNAIPCVRMKPVRALKKSGIFHREFTRFNVLSYANSVGKIPEIHTREKAVWGKVLDALQQWSDALKS